MSEWREVHLRDVAKIVSGGTPSRYVSEYWEPKEIPWVTPTDITSTKGRFLSETKEHVSSLGLAASSATLLPEGAILMTSRATLGELRVARREVCTNQGFKSLVPMKGTDCQFLYYMMLNNRSRYESLGIGSTFLEVNKKDTENFLIQVTDIPHQRRIAEILSTVDEAIEQTERLIAKQQQIKAGLMQDLFTRGVWTAATIERARASGSSAAATAEVGQLRPPREIAPELYKESPLGWIPKDWEVKKLGEILNQYGGQLQTGPFGSQLHAHEYQNEGVPVVMPQDINNGCIGVTQIARIHERRADELGRHRMRVGDIVIARRGDLSRAAAILHDHAGWLCGTGCFLLRLSGSELHSEFASLVYRQDFVQKQVDARAVGATMPSLNNDVMRSLLYPFCSPAEQEAIVERLGAVNHQLQLNEDYRDKLNKQKYGLMQDLLTGKVPVGSPEVNG